MGVGSRMVLTREIMERYKSIEREIIRIRRKLDWYAANEVKQSHGVVKGSMHSYPYAEKHFVVSGSDLKSEKERDNKIQQLMVMLNARLEDYSKFELEIELAIEEIEELEMRQIIEMKYIEKMTDEQIAMELDYERSTITKKIAKFFDDCELSHNSHSESANMIL